MDKNKTKDGWLGIGIFLLYTAVSYLKHIPLLLLNINNISENFAMIYSLTVSIILTFIIMYLLRKKLKNDYLDIKKNHRIYFKKYFKYWLISLIFMALSNFTILFFTKSSLPNNEELIKEMFKINPFIIFISAVLVAPILEELVFRQSFRYMFSDNISFILFSAFTFGSFHVLGTVDNFSDLLFIIPYSIPGIAFSLTLAEDDNILVPIGLHFMHNGILMSLQVLLLLFS